MVTIILVFLQQLTRISHMQMVKYTQLEALKTNASRFGSLNMMQKCYLEIFNNIEHFIVSDK